MKIFYGIKIKLNIVDDVIKIVDRELNGFRGKFTEPRNYHLTFKFLGEIPDEDFQNHIDELNEIAQKVNSFDVVFDKLNTFQRSKGNIIWIGFTKGLNEYEELVSVIDPEIKNPIPHLTLIRNTKEIINKRINEFKMCIDEITLFESKRIDNKLSYIPLYTVKLK